MRKFRVEFKQDSENVANCLCRDSNDIKYTTDAVLSPNEEFLVIKTIKAICQTSVLLGGAYKSYESKDYKTFKLAVNYLKDGTVKDIQPTFNNVRDNFERYSAISCFDVEFDEKTLDVNISTIPIPLYIKLFGGKVHPIAIWKGNLNVLKAAYQKCA